MIIINHDTNTDILVEDATKAYNEYHLNSLEIDVTNQCPCCCPFCFLGNNHNKLNSEMSFDKIKQILTEARDMGVYYVSFSGGEPFVRKDFMDILRYAKNMGFFITFVSSLQIPSIEEIQELGELGISRVLVSFHSANPDKYAKIFGVKRDLYYRALENIKQLSESETPLGISVTTFSENNDELEEILDLFINLGIKKEDVHFNVLIEGKNKIKKLRGGSDFFKYLENKQYLKENILSKTRTSDRSFMCSVGRSALIIRPDGTAIPCGFMDIVAGDINKQSLKNIWECSGVLKMIRSIREEFFSKCINCSEIQNCPVCMAANLNETGNPFDPSEDYCRFHTGLIHSFMRGNI